MNFYPVVLRSFADDENLYFLTSNWIEKGENQAHCETLTALSWRDKN